MRAISLYLLLIFILGACRERYGLPIEKSLFNSLVVEGNILKGDSTVIKLSRTSAVGEQNLLPEKGATIRVEGDDNSSVTLFESDSGVYKAAPIDLNPSVHYRLRISSSGKEYESEWTSLINTADIDSIYWERKNGVEIFVKSSGAPEDNRYYKWDYEETFDFYSEYKSKAYYTYVVDSSGKRTIQCVDKEMGGNVRNICIDWYDMYGHQKQAGYASYSDSLDHCWKHDINRNIMIGSTAAQSDNVVISPLRRIQEGGWEISSLYSILVKQTGLSKEAYEFYRILKGNSEGMGSIFDAQPSQLKTNLKCTSDPGETVIGYTNTTSVKTKRKFISVKELPDWHYFESFNCGIDTVWVGVRALLVGNGTHAEQIATALTIGQVPVDPLEWEGEPPYKILKYSSVSKVCVDCRVRGVHEKPAFWP